MLRRISWCLCAISVTTVVALDACDATDSSISWAAQPVQPPGCAAVVAEDEAALLSHKCLLADAAETSCPAACTDNPLERCHYDPACALGSEDPKGGLGCNAGGHAHCRFCGFGDYAWSCDDAPAVEQAVCACMRRRWWRAAQQLLPRVPAGKQAVVRQFAQALRDGAGGVVTDLLRGSSTGIQHDRVTSAVPAVQWAQSAAAVHVLVRFTVKKHGPVAVANVDDAKVELEARRVRFTAKARGKPLIFELELPLEQNIVPDESSYSFEGRGQLTMTLRKEEQGKDWAQLAPPDDGATRRGALSPWYEMQEKFEREKPKKAPKEETKKAPKEETKKAPKDAVEAQAVPKDKETAKETAKETDGAKKKKKKKESKAPKAKPPPDGWLAWVRWKAEQWWRPVKDLWRRWFASG